MKWSEIRMVVVSVLGLCLFLAVDVPTARADFTFGEPVELGPHINHPVTDQFGQGFPCISPDGLELYFCRNVPGTRYDIFVARRPTVDSEWGEPVSLGPTVNSVTFDWSLSISADGLSLYYTYGGSAGYPWRLYVTKRETIHDDWGPPANIGGAMANVAAYGSAISPDDLELYFSVERAGGYGGNDLWVTKRATVNDPWGTPVNLGPVVNSPYGESDPVVSPDGLLLFFGSRDDWGRWGTYVTRRATKNDPWGPRANVGFILSTSGYTGTERPGGISSDGSMLYVFCDFRRTIWEAPILPVVDFTGDGIVDTKDLARLIDSWGQADPLCDIGPFAWGDGVVDAADLEVFMRYWGQEVYDATLVGHWPLDEAEGMIAHDPAGGNDATILGLPQWQPEGGKIDGALELNGNTFATATSPMNPASGPFSVLAWIQGGAPGQVILSQEGGMNWLMADGATGALMTEVGPPGRTGPGLISEAVITDGNWHRIAFIWDGANRWLYVDGVLVAEDTRDDLPSCSGKLVFGAGKDMAPATFFTGLIDEVRIYNRAVWP